MSMGRKRSRATSTLPANLYPNREGFKYRHPVTRKETWMGRDRTAAIAAARKLNSILMTTTGLVEKVLGEGKRVRDAIKVFRDEDVPQRKWAEKTASEHDIKLRRIEADIGARELGAFGVRETAEYLRTVTESVRARQQYRLLLIWIFACAVEEGWIDQNPAESTRKIRSERKRERLTMEQYQAIHAKAAPWLQNAMDLSVNTLLRREDICSLKFADIREGCLWVIPSKTENSTGARLKIRIGGELQAVLERCRDSVASPYLVHRLPERARPRELRAERRIHHTQVLPEQLSRAFAEARDAAGVESENPPTFHEIRSLGGKRYQERGWTIEQVQALMAHSSEAMTKHYLDGHGTPWTEVAI